jgi:hypothetical protein
MNKALLILIALSAGNVISFARQGTVSNLKTVEIGHFNFSRTDKDAQIPEAL